MPAGFETFDGAGNLIISVTDRITKILGTVDTGTSDGSIYVPGFSFGRPWVRGSAYTNGSPNELAAVAYISGNTIIWYFVGPGDTPPPFTVRRNTKLTYGIY